MLAISLLSLLPVACATDHELRRGDAPDDAMDPTEDAGDADAGTTAPAEDALAFRDDFERTEGLIAGEMWFGAEAQPAQLREGRMCFGGGDRFEISLPSSGRYTYLQLDLIRGDVDGLEIAASGADAESALFRISDRTDTLALAGVHANPHHGSIPTLGALESVPVIRLVGEFDAQQNGYRFRANAEAEKFDKSTSETVSGSYLRSLSFHNWRAPSEAPTCIDNVYVGTHRPSADPFAP